MRRIYLSGVSIGLKIKLIYIKVGLFEYIIKGKKSYIK